MQIENMQNFILFVHLLSYLVSFIACSLVKFKKQFSPTREVKLKIKEFIVEKLASEQFTWKMMPTCLFRGAV